MTEEAPIRVGLRVEDVTEAATFYQGLGFERTGSISNPDGRTVMAILRRGDLQLLVDALVGMPFPDSDRERMTRTSPRGLGVVIGIEVTDVDATADYCRSAGCQVTTGPADAPWGERYVECLDVVSGPSRAARSRNTPSLPDPGRRACPALHGIPVTYAEAATVGRPSSSR